MAIVSVPGEYAALEAHHALTAGLHVLLFSDGVPLEEEIELKERAAALGLLVMGPGAGTAVLGGTGLGFANVFAALPVRPGSAGSGSWLQREPARKRCPHLLDRWGAGVSQVVGVGGRDMSEQVGGRMAQIAVRALDDDPDTDAVLVVSKPPSPAAAERCCSNAGPPRASRSSSACRDLEPALVRAARPHPEAGCPRGAKAGRRGPRLNPRPGCGRRSLRRRLGLVPRRRTVRGLFSGGTLCYEAQLILEELLGEVYSNEPLRERHGLPAPDGAHVLLDLGAEEYTRGVPHPMIEPSGRSRCCASSRTTRTWPSC